MITGIIHKYISPSNKVYIGQTINEYERKHAFLTREKYAGDKIDNARKKYGPVNFKYEILEKHEYLTVEEASESLNILEAYYIGLYDSFRKGYNMSLGGGGLFERFNRMSDSLTEEDMYEIMKMAREKKNSGNEHFNESYAKYLVSNMYHYEGGRKYVGEKFSMAKAKEVCERYRGVIPQSFTHADVYVAINEHYHNCSELFKSWFGEDIDQKVIEAAILFWFKDDDCKSNSKLWNHFKEN